MTSFPESAYTKTLGLLCFARMLSKIRLHAAGSLPPDYHQNLGRGADGWCCEFLHVSYEDVRARTLEGGTNEEVLEWCIAQGRPLNKTDIMVWNYFIERLGKEDFAARVLERYKKESGFADRADIQTMVEYFEYDEGRKV